MFDSRADKYNSADLDISSADRDWTGVLAQVLSHSGGVISKNSAQPVTELVIDPQGDSRTIVTRKAYDILERTPTTRGMSWICPKGIQEDLVELSSPMPGLLHLYLEPHHFSSPALGDHFDGSEFTTIRFEKGFGDELIAHIGYAILAELHNPTAAGRLLVETLACCIGARLIQRFTSTSPARLSSLEVTPDLGIKRIRHVMDYVEDNIEAPISLDDLASVAYLSRFHFARSFKKVTGKTPHEYVNDRRMERAKTLLRHRNRSLTEVATALNFSSLSTFSRAFRQHTGLTPSQFPRSVHDSDITG